MKTFLKSLFFFLFWGFNSYGQAGLIVNEMSNGPATTQEYIELFVVGTPCTTVDIRGWIVDDNNGLDNSVGPGCQGFGLTANASGVAQGHIAFQSIPRWAAVPVGSIILLYNSNDKNPNILLPDDPTDANGDLVYIVPIDDAGMEVCGTVPNGITPDCTYTPCVYAPTAIGSWLTIGLRNAGDAAQVRSPGGAYFHGISYGTVGNNMTGGVDNLHILIADGTQRAIAFTCGDYRVAANFVSGTAGPFETPGYTNNALNTQFIAYYRCPSSGDNCSRNLPIELVSFTAKGKDKEVVLEWVTSVEVNNSYFSVERSANGKDFESIGTVRGNGNSTALNHYTFTDAKPFGGTSFYRLKQVDYDGKYSNSAIASVQLTLSHITLNAVYPSPAHEQTQVEIYSPSAAGVRLQVSDLPGRTMSENNLSLAEGLNNIPLSISSLSAGIYFVKLFDEHGLIASQRIVKN